MLSCFADNRIAMENLVYLIKFVPFFQKAKNYYTLFLYQTEMRKTNNKNVDLLSLLNKFIFKIYFPVRIQAYVF